MSSSVQTILRMHPQQRLLYGAKLLTTIFKRVTFAELITAYDAPMQGGWPALRFDLDLIVDTHKQDVTLLAVRRGQKALWFIAKSSIRHESKPPEDNYTWSYIGEMDAIGHEVGIVERLRIVVDEFDKAFSINVFTVADWCFPGKPETSIYRKCRAEIEIASDGLTPLAKLLRSEDRQRAA